MYFVYILKLGNGSLYKGRTDDIDRRLNEHAQGKTKSIKSYLPFVLTHVEVVESLKKAIEMERYFKSGIGREIIKELFK